MFNVLFHSLENNAGALTNFEVLDFLRAKGASKDPSRVLAKVAMSEYKVCYSDETTNLFSIRDFSCSPIDSNDFLCFIGGLLCCIFYRFMITWLTLPLFLKQERASRSISQLLNSMICQRRRF